MGEIEAAHEKLTVQASESLSKGQNRASHCLRAPQLRCLHHQRCQLAHDTLYQQAYAIVMLELAQLARDDCGC